MKTLKLILSLVFFAALTITASAQNSHFRRPNKSVVYHQKLQRDKSYDVMIKENQAFTLKSARYSFYIEKQKIKKDKKSKSDAKKRNNMHKRIEELKNKNK